MLPPPPPSPISGDIIFQPFTATLFGELERLNAELGDERKAWEQGKTEQTAQRNTWEATRKVLCEELALAIRVKSDEAFVAGEAIRALDDKLEENNQNFRAFRATTDAQLTGEFRGFVCGQRTGRGWQ